MLLETYNIINLKIFLFFIIIYIYTISRSRNPIGQALDTAPVTFLRKLSPVLLKLTVTLKGSYPTFIPVNIPRYPTHVVAYAIIYLFFTNYISIVKGFK